MGLFDDINQFVENQLDDFFKKNPHLELSALEEQLREQERDTQKIIAEFKLKEKQLQDEILAIAEKIQTWHGRVSKAQAAGRQDLAEAAKEREAALLRQGNQTWGKMEGVKKRIPQAEELLLQIQRRIKEVKNQYAQVKADSSNKNKSDNYTKGWNQGVKDNYTATADPLEAKFLQWELDDELEQMKKKMN